MNLGLNSRAWVAVVALALATLCPGIVHAQTYKEDFTGTTTNNNWFFYNGACLTAGSSSSSVEPGTIPGCIQILSSYYGQQSDHDANLVGGASGYLGSSSAPSTADPSGQGALRFTNGYPYGHSENGAIVSSFTFPSSQGLDITFKTVTYLGDSGGAGKDGADGISFYLLDGCMPLSGATLPSGCGSNPIYGTQTFPGIGSWGGSLAYTCSNQNQNYDGLVGAYLGLGIDEYGNFLNGSGNSATNGETDGSVTNGGYGDNTASGGLYKPGRIGLRGAGSISWLALNTAYGTNPNDSTKPYYPASLATSCSTGTYSSTMGACEVCSSGNYFAGTNTCNSCPVGTYDSTTGMCDNAACAAGTLESNGQYPNQCYVCPSGDSLRYRTSNGTYYCTNSGTLTHQSPTLPASASTSSPSTGVPYSWLAVQNTCESGNLFNFGSTNPSPRGTPPPASAEVGAASLSNAVNTAGILDYQAIPGAYSVPGINIANESATTRAGATPIFYDVKITPAGYLTLSYSINGGAYQAVIKNQLITNSNGPLPSSFRFGFAGSTGGDTNVHELLCFKVAPSSESGGSTAVNEKQSSKLQPNATQAYFGYYNPTPTFWTGDLTANYLVDTGGAVTVSTVANWSASCVLTGVASGQTCPKTGVGPSSAESPSSRTMLTWDTTNLTGIPFEWSSLNANQQAALNDADSLGQARVSFLRGDRSNEVGGSSGTNEFRYREGVLADIVDSSPTWVGPPSAPYTAAWTDRLNPTASQPENSGDQTYLQFIASEQTRTNVVYVGANDGFVHGFRAGSYDASGNYIATYNDGSEVLAYMPGAVLQSLASACAYSTANPTQSVVQNIHGVIPANSTCSPATTSDSVTKALDYSNPQYGHNFFVDATPGSGDLFYADATHTNGAWHTWLVGGLGAGGGAIYALDITNPSTFSESSNGPKSTVIGEWTAATSACTTSGTCPPSTITCSGNASCGSSLGYTYGTPLIRRLHNGAWAVIFGNGIGSSSGDAGIFIMSIDPKTAAKTFYYLSTGVGSTASGGTPNGITYVASADLDGDHVTDYIYAGDLQGNLWRFDLTSTNPSMWTSTSPFLLFTTQTGQPITSQVVVASVPVAGASPRIMVALGTGQRTQFTNTSQPVYASAAQSLYGVWDWNMSAWNALSPSQTYQALSPGSPYALTATNLTQQTFTCTTGTTITCDGTSATICWQGSSACPSGDNKFGWYANLAATLTNYGAEQIIYNPAFYNGAFIVDSTIPATNNVLSCTTNLDRGLTYVLSLGTGSVLTNAFPHYNDTQLSGVETDATGTPSVVTTTEGTTTLVYQTVSGTPGTQQINPPANTKATRLTWIQLR